MGCPRRRWCAARARGPAHPGATTMGALASCMKHGTAALSWEHDAWQLVSRWMLLLRRGPGMGATCPAHARTHAHR